jgi:hypothetical protein
MGVPKPIIRPARNLVISSAHQESGTALTNEGLLLGNTDFESVTPRLAQDASFGRWM